jgi:hypothetical protein
MLDSLTAPVVIKHNWIFSGPFCDFMLSPIQYLEETTGAVIKVRINGSEFWIPATWFIMVTDVETCLIDTVSIQACATNKHVAFSFSPDESNLRVLDVMILDYEESMALVHPMISKGTALVHPVGPSPPLHGKTHQLSVVIGPHDLYKYLTNKVIGDVFSW